MAQEDYQELLVHQGRGDPEVQGDHQAHLARLGKLVREVYVVVQVQMVNQDQKDNLVIVE